MLKIKRLAHGRLRRRRLPLRHRRSKEVGSLLLGLYDDQGLLDHVGFTSAISDAERPALTRKLEKLRGGPGFTGDAPGGPSRWSTERSSQWEPLQAQAGRRGAVRSRDRQRFRHGTRFVRWRPDKLPHAMHHGSVAARRRGRRG